METYICLSMQTFFNTTELDFIHNRQAFETKVNASLKTAACLQELDIYLRKQEGLHLLDKALASKITKGENLGGYPYFVLDMPSLQAEANIASFRTIVWWGNNISVYLILGEQVFPDFKEKIERRLQENLHEACYISISDSFWHHDITDATYYTKASQWNIEEMKNLKKFKAAVLLPLDSLNDLENVAVAIRYLNSLLD